MAKAATKKSPTFAARKELARWVDEANLGKGGRVSSTAYMPAIDEMYLSVNALELETLTTIGTYYRKTLQAGVGKVAIACLKITDYVRASKAGGVIVNYDRNSAGWMFQDGASKSSAFRLRETHLSASHCGVETIRLMNEDSATKFARRLAGRPPGKSPHVLP